MENIQRISKQELKTHCKYSWSMIKSLINIILICIKQLCHSKYAENTWGEMKHFHLKLCNICISNASFNIVFSFFFVPFPNYACCVINRKGDYWKCVEFFIFVSHYLISYFPKFWYFWCVSILKIIFLRILSFFFQN